MAVRGVSSSQLLCLKYPISWFTHHNQSHHDINSSMHYIFTPNKNRWWHPVSKKTNQHLNGMAQAQDPNVHVFRRHWQSWRRGHRCQDMDGLTSIWGYTNWKVRYILVYKDPLLTHLLVSVPSILTLRYTSAICFSWKAFFGTPYFWPLNFMLSWGPGRFLLQVQTPPLKGSNDSYGCWGVSACWGVKNNDYFTKIWRIDTQKWWALEKVSDFEYGYFAGVSGIHVKFQCMLGDVSAFPPMPGCNPSGDQPNIPLTYKVNQVNAPPQSCNNIFRFLHGHHKRSLSC